MTTSEGRALTFGSLQSGYLIATGVWPLLHMASFEAVTGQKKDRWLVKTVGLLISVAGATIGSATVRRRFTPDIRFLAAGTAAALAAVDLIYTAKGRISRVYLLDAVLEAALLAGWATAFDPRKNESDPTTLIECVRRTVQRVSHATLASVTAQGEPWNTPLQVGCDDRYDFFWISDSESQHSKNFLRTPEGFLVIYDTGHSDESGCCLYARVAVSEVVDRNESEHALDTIYARRQGSAPELAAFMATGQRLYRARPIKAWTNVLTNREGLPKDERVPVNLRA
jgi:hypothetical protein